MADNKGVIRTPAGSMPTSAADKEAVCGASWKNGHCFEDNLHAAKIQEEGLKFTEIMTCNICKISILAYAICFLEAERRRDVE